LSLKAGFETLKILAPSLEEIADGQEGEVVDSRTCRLSRWFYFLVRLFSRDAPFEAVQAFLVMSPRRST